MSLLVPNLSGLKLKDEEENTGAVRGYRPPDPPGIVSEANSEAVENDYYKGLYGKTALKAIAASIENDEIIASYQSIPMYETFSERNNFNLAFHTVKWWFAWQKFAVKIPIGGGTHNSAYLVPPGDSLPPDEMFNDPNGYNLPRPTKGIIIRIGKVVTRGPDRHAAPTKEQHICEMITAAYAHAHGFGPVIYAQFYMGSTAELMYAQKNAVRGVAWNAQVPAFIPPNAMAGTIGDHKANFTCTIAEAWEGDCVRKIDNSLPMYQQFDPTIFAKEFVRLCALAADAGFWHMDIKRANLLYRAAPTATDPNAIELTFTDFDSYFCRVMAPHLRARTRNCCIAATAACFLGEIRCQESKEVWLRFAEPIREAMKDLADPVDVQAIDPMDWCFFLRSVNETRKVTNPDGSISVMLSEKSNHEWIIGDRFRNHMNNYFYENNDDNDKNNNRCFKLDPKQPLFPQVVHYAFVTWFS